MLGDEFTLVKLLVQLYCKTDVRNRTEPLASFLVCMVETSPNIDRIALRKSHTHSVDSALGCSEHRAQNHTSQSRAWQKAKWKLQNFADNNRVVKLDQIALANVSKKKSS